MAKLFPLSFIALALALAATPSLAAPSGGGSLPSASAPRYDAAAEYRAGIAALQQDDFRKAEKHLKRVVRASPKNANAHYVLGMAQAGRDKHKNARKSFARALKLDPDMLTARRELGVTYARLGEADKAAEALADLQRRKAACGTCAKAAAIEQAIAAIETALAGGTQALLRPEDSLLLTRPESGDRRYLEAVALINESKYDEAILRLRQAEAAVGPHPDILTYLGFANRKRGRLEAAETYYRSALAVAPAHKGATEYYGELLVERGDLGGAERMLAKLDAICDFGCAEAEELRRWISAARSAAR